MRWSIALVAALLLAGCSSKGGDQGPDVGILATDLQAGNVTQTVFPLEFAGGTREAELAISETFAATDACFLQFPQCVGPAERSYDLTPIIPSDVPVEMSIELDADNNLNIEFQMEEAQFIQQSEEGNGGANRIDALLVRAAAGTVTLVITYEFPDPSAAQGFTLTGKVHTVTRSNVVPPLLPVAIELGPGDIVNASGDGLEHFVAYPPTGTPLRALQNPFSIQVPADGPKGVWYLIGDADEAVRFTGPNRTISARLLEIIETDPVDVASNADTTFTMDVPTQPLLVGIGLQSKRLNPPGFFAGASLLGDYQVSLRSPGNVQVISDGDACAPAMCEQSVLRGISADYPSDFLGEHLTPGTYSATISVETANDIQAFGYALAIKAA
ncbi:MAG: hypothetical protein QOC71_1520 [Thermoplasmata archaeon]|nr:hypothetical protein [Thermoplasmata archaeon]